MKKVNRKNKISIIDALNEAQKLAFAPLAFQALASMLDLGIVDFLDKKPSDKKYILRIFKAEPNITVFLIPAYGDD